MLTYSPDELLAEKVRALYERTRPRDLYDVVYLLENLPETFDLSRAHGLLKEKCDAKNLERPDLALLLRTVQDAEELRSEWSNMLAHQLPELPDLDALLPRVSSLLRWVDQPLVVAPDMELPVVPIRVGAAAMPSPSIEYWGENVPLEAIRFAGANRLLVDFDYDGRRRRVEPYSVRRENTGNINLYAWEQGGTHIKAFSLSKIRDFRTTKVPFQPRYRIELAPGGMAASLPSATPVHRRVPGRPSRGRSAATGLTYVFECFYCQRKFKHSKNDPSLGKHKTKDGWDCPGRRGYLTEVT